MSYSKTIDIYVNFQNMKFAYDDKDAQLIFNNWYSHNDVVEQTW